LVVDPFDVPPPVHSMWRSSAFPADAVGRMGAGWLTMETSSDYGDYPRP
jgi:hypothetical protein